MKYTLILVSRDNNILEFSTFANTSVEAEGNAFKYIDRKGWSHFSYIIKYIKEEK